MSLPRISLWPLSWIGLLAASPLALAGDPPCVQMAKSNPRTATMRPIRAKDGNYREFLDSRERSRVFMVAPEGMAPDYESYDHSAHLFGSTYLGVKLPIAARSREGIVIIFNYSFYGVGNNHDKNRERANSLARFLRADHSGNYVFYFRESSQAVWGHAFSVTGLGSTPMVSVTDAKVLDRATGKTISLDRFTGKLISSQIETNTKRKMRQESS